MAKFYNNKITDNELKIEELKAKNRKNGLKALIAFLIAFVDLVFKLPIPYPIFNTYILGLYVYWGILIKRSYSNSKERAIIQSGVQGEKMAENFLSGLSDDYHILSNIPLQKGNKRTEIDFLVMSNHGAYVIECKNHNGSIEGDKEADTWTQYKVGEGGTPYTKELKNPLKQMHFQKYLLSEILKDNNIKMWVDGCVLMTGAESVDVNSEEVVYTPQQVINVLSKESEHTISDEKIAQVINLFK